MSSEKRTDLRECVLHVFFVFFLLAGSCFYDRVRAGACLSYKNGVSGSLAKILWCVYVCV